MRAVSQLAGHTKIDLPLRAFLFDANSLLRNILRVSSVKSRFCELASEAIACNHKKTNGLLESGDSTTTNQPSSNSLFCNILAVSYLKSIFYVSSRGPNSRKLEKTRILADPPQKKSKRDFPRPKSRAPVQRAASRQLPRTLLNFSFPS